MRAFSLFLCVFVAVVSTKWVNSALVPSPEKKSCEVNVIEDEPKKEWKVQPKILRYSSGESLDDPRVIFTHLFDVFNIRKYLNQARSRISSTVLCIACKMGMSLLNQYLKKGATEEDVGNMTRRICIILRIETPRVCDGISHLFKREVVQVLLNVALTPEEICGLAIGSTCSNHVNPLHNWTVPLTPFPKPPIRPIKTPKPGSPVTTVLHLSDIHLDPAYKEGSLASCDEPLCCHANSGPVTHPKDGAGYWGDYRDCDTPLRTLENVLDHINKTHKIDYVIWTGDIPPHDVWNTSREQSTYLLHKTSMIVKKYLGAVPIYPALGNHESSPVDSFPVPQVRGKDSIDWLYSELVKAWAPWFPPHVSQTLRMGGYYSVLVNPGFRIISINMNYCNSLNWWLLLNSTDPTGELSWLVYELQLAEIKGEKVHIIGHIPPGNFDCLRVWSHNYYSIIKRYESTVTAQFFGHTHNDEFEIFYDTDLYTPTSRAFGIAYIGPSVTTFTGLNPGYRIYTVDGNYENSSRVVLDHETHFLNLTEANLTNEPKWQFEYSMKKWFDMTSLLPEDWDLLTKKFEGDDELFQQFYRFYNKLSDSITEKCDAHCKSVLLCRLRKGCSDRGLCL